MVDNLSIAYGTTIDSAIGGSANDVFIANAGSDTIDGGGGTDNIVYLPQPRADYVYTRIGRDIELTGTLDANGTTEKLRNVQTVAFSDITLDSSSLGSIVWTGTGGDNFYDNINNWDLHQLPAVSNDVTIGAGFIVEVTLGPANSVDSIRTGATAQLNIDVGHFVVDGGVAASDNAGTITVGSATTATLYMSGTFANTGRIELPSTGQVQTNGGTTTLGGGGTIDLQGGAIGGSGTKPVVYDVMISDNTMHGYGYVGGNHDFLFPLTLVNQGTIIADDPAVPLTLSGSIVNQGLLKGTAHGGLVQHDGVDNRLGTIDADGPTGNVQFEAGIVAGGIIESTNGGALEVSGNDTLDGTATAVTLFGPMTIDSAASLELSGTITGNGTIDATHAVLVISNGWVSGVQILGGAGHVYYTGNGNHIVSGPYGADLGSGLALAVGQSIAFDSVSGGGVGNRSVLAMGGSRDSGNVAHGATINATGGLSLYGGGSVTMANEADRIQGTPDLSDGFYNGDNTVAGAGAIAGFTYIINGGTILAAGGHMVLDSPKLTNYGFMGADATGILDLLGTLDNNSGTLGGAGTIVLGGTLDGVAATGGINGATLAAGGTVEIAAPGGELSQTVASLLLQSSFQYKLVPDNHNGNFVVVACFAAGTRIATPHGEQAVETLAVGDTVLVASGAEQDVTWIGRRRVDLRRHPEAARVQPVRIAAGAFGQGRPRRDLCLSPDHAVLAGDVLIPIKLMINGTSIAQVSMDEVTYYHVELPHHDVLLAEGLACESYLDTGNRANFANNHEQVVLHPDFSSLLWDAAACAPLIVTGPKLGAARRLVSTHTSAAMAQRGALGRQAV